jgi:hypothetical protein
MPQQNPTTVLPALRIVAGVGAWAFPTLTGKVIGLNVSSDNHQAIYMGRLFGARDIVLGAGVLASSGDAKKLWWRLGILADAADAAASFQGLRAGGPKRGMITATAVALGAVGLGIAAAGSIGE